MSDIRNFHAVNEIRALRQALAFEATVLSDYRQSRAFPKSVAQDAAQLETSLQAGARGESLHLHPIFSNVQRRPDVGHALDYSERAAAEISELRQTCADAAEIATGFLVFKTLPHRDAVVEQVARLTKSASGQVYFAYAVIAYFQLRSAARAAGAEPISIESWEQEYVRASRNAVHPGSRHDRLLRR